MKNTSKKKKSFWSYLLSIPAGMVALFLVFTAVSPFINPTYFFPAFLTGLCFPAVFALGIIFSLLYLFFNWKHSLLLILTLGLNYTNIRNFIRFSGSDEPNPSEWREEGRFKIMSYNVLLFGYYQNRETREQLLAFLKDQDADILCFQEYFERPEANFPVSGILRKYGYRYSTLPLCKKKPFSGNVIFSKHPIVNQGIADSLTQLDAVYADIRIGNQKVRVYSIHLESYRFDHMDQQFVTQMTQETHDLDYYKGGALRMMSKMKRASSVRIRQIDHLMEFFQKEESDENAIRNIILCGDMNDQPVSYTYRSFTRKGLTDAFVQKGKGLGQTYEGIYPSYRIDYILHQGKTECLYFNTHKVDYSDHRPVSAVFSIHRTDKNPEIQNKRS